MDALLEHLYRYPVRGLSAEALSSVELTSGNTIPFDRRYAIENGPIGFDPAVPKYFKKPHFLMLMRDERMATLQSRFDARTCVLSLSHSGNEVATGNLETEVGRKHIEDFLQEYFAKELKGRPKILSAPDHSFCDVDMRVVSIINLATLNELSSTAGQYVHPLRFRANLYVSGWPSWHEFSLVGQEIWVGATKLRVVKRTMRCAATSVNPLTAERDINIPGLIARTYRHPDCGVYAEVVSDGRIAIGDRVRAA